MNILLIHQYFLEDDDAGGSRFNEMVKLWEAKGHKVTVLAGMVHYTKGVKRDRYKGKFVVKRKQGNTEVYRCHVSEAYNVNFLGRLWAYFSFVFSSLFVGIFKIKEKNDLILVTSPPLFVGITAYFISRLKRIPFVFEVRDLWPESAIDTGVLKNKLIIKLAYWFEAFLYRKAKLINVLTPAFKEALIKKNVPKDKIIFIPNAADFSLSEKVLMSDFDRESFRVANGLDGKFVVTYVGAHGVANALGQVIDVAQRVTDTNVLFLLIGEGMEKIQIKEHAKSLGLTNVRFIDAVPKLEVFKYIIASEMGMSVLKNVPTFKTIYSNKTFDYMSCKKPILMAIDGVSRQLVEESESGTFIKPEDANDFERVIRRYLKEPQSLSKEGESGYGYAVKYFDRSKLAEQYLNSLEKMI